MAYLYAEFYSDALKRTVPIYAILPVDKKDDSRVKVAGGCKTLYLLHGLTASASDWLTYSRIRQWAEELGIAVIMPSGENSFYVDAVQPNHEYGRFIGEELVAVTRDMFHLSARREDTFIGGLSMGGFGAIRNGLRYARTFGAIVALSSAIHFFETPEGIAPSNLFHEELCFGDMAQARRSDKNPRVLVERILEAQAKGEALPMPRIYMACGTEDGLLGANHSFRDFLLSRGVAVTYEEGPGVHDWNFWDPYIRRGLDFLLSAEN